MQYNTVRVGAGWLLRIAVFLLCAALAACQSTPENLPAAADHDPDLVHPYLQLAGPGAVPTIIWTTEQAEVGAVALSRDGRLEAEFPMTAAAPRHFVPLEDLLPDTEYSYSVTAGKRRSSEHRFRTLPQRQPDGTSAPFQFVAYGDNRSQPERHEEVIAAILRGPIPSLIVSSGDLVYSGSDRERWHAEFLNPAEVLFAGSPVLLSLGNHDLDLDAPKPRPLAPFWLENFSFPGRPDLPGYGRWFSFEAGGVHFIILDSTDPENSMQMDWLRKDLSSPASREADFRVGVFHHPPYSAGGHDSLESLRSLWEPLLVEHQVDLVFNGHNHFYQRSWPVIDGRVVTRGQRIDGVDVFPTGMAPVYVVTGGGGAPLYDPEEAEFVAVNAKRHHHLLIRYEAGSLSCRTLATDGELLDEFTIRHAD